MQSGRSSTACSMHSTHYPPLDVGRWCRVRRRGRDLGQVAAPAANLEGMADGDVVDSVTEQQPSRSRRPVL